ncbi:MAG: ATP-binding protein [Candidatus Melainabacteria bacterium]|nr:ATP-binding protein [Candidatus Melainabacteria bacterium]
MFKRLVKLPENKSFFLFGPRQVGKTTVLGEFFDDKNTLVYNLLDPDTFNALNLSPSNFKNEITSRKKNVSHVIVDEIQKLPELLDQVHLLLESENPPCFALSGSSARKLKKSGANLLGGRAWTIAMYPLCYQEFLLNKQTFNLEQALNYGTLPAIYLEEDDFAKEQVLKAYINTYLKEEIKEESLVRNIKGFSNFLRFSAEENGNVLNFSNIARDTGVDSKTVKEYFQILEDTLIGFFLMPFASSHRTRLVKHPKFYFFDTGVHRALTNKLSLKLEKKTKAYGNAFEHFIIKELMNYSNYINKDYDFFFYRTEAGAEVDLIIKKPDDSFLAIEIKASINPELKNLKGLFSFKDLYPEAELICLSQATKRRKLKEITILPWQEIFEYLV